MIALVLVALVVVVGAFALASRFVGWRSEQRSVDSYERALDVLGGMSRRSEASAPVHLPSDEEVAGPHGAARRAGCPRAPRAAGATAHLRARSPGLRGRGDGRPRAAGATAHLR